MTSEKDNVSDSVGSQERNGNAESSQLGRTGGRGLTEHWRGIESIGEEWKVKTEEGTRVWG